MKNTARIYACFKRAFLFIVLLLMVEVSDAAIPHMAFLNKTVTGLRFINPTCILPVCLQIIIFIAWAMITNLIFGLVHKKG